MKQKSAGYLLIFFSRCQAQLSYNATRQLFWVQLFFNLIQSWRQSKVLTSGDARLIVMWL